VFFLRYKPNYVWVLPRVRTPHIEHKPSEFYSFQVCLRTFGAFSGQSNNSSLYSKDRISLSNNFRARHCCFLSRSVRSGASSQSTPLQRVSGSWLGGRPSVSRVCLGFLGFIRAPSAPFVILSGNH